MAADPVDLAARARARQAVLATFGVYLTFGVMGQVPGLAAARGLALVAAFYFVPGWLLRREPEVQARFEIGPESPIPRWSWRGARVAALAALLLFPPFTLAFWGFYAEVCAGDLWPVAPVLWVEGHTPWAGGLEHYLARLCRGHDHTFFPEALRLPAAWTAYYGLGFVYEVAVGLFAVGHLVGMAQSARLATFFPALVFAWLWRRSGSLWAPALFHTASNLLMDLLLASTFAP